MPSHPSPTGTAAGTRTGNVSRHEVSRGHACSVAASLPFGHTLSSHCGLERLHSRPICRSSCPSRALSSMSAATHHSSQQPLLCLPPLAPLQYKATCVPTGSFSPSPRLRGPQPSFQSQSTMRTFHHSARVQSYGKPALPVSTITHYSVVTATAISEKAHLQITSSYSL